MVDPIQLLHQLQPGALDDIFGVGVAKLVPAADGPDQRAVPLDEHVPGPLLAMSGPGHQINDHRIIAYRISAGSRKDTGAAASVPGALVLGGEMRDGGGRPCWVGLCYGRAHPGGHDLVLLGCSERAEDAPARPYHEDWPSHRLPGQAWR
jgi:hypothetical protein